MYCPKCGKELPDNAKFCSGCGSQIQSAETTNNQAEQTAQQAQPFNQNEGVQQPVQPVNYNQTPAQQSFNPNTGAQQSVQPANYNQASVQPKKPMSKKTKLAILFSSIGVVVVAVALIVVFAVIIPSMNKVNVSDYIDVGFNKEALYDGEIESIVAIDKKELVSANEMDETEVYDNFESLQDNNDWYTIINQLGYPDYSELTSALSHCNISAHKKGDDGNAETCEGDGTLTLNDLKKDDVLVIDITWDDSSYAQEEIKYCQKELGVNFDTSDQSVEIKVSDRLESLGLELKEKVNVDFFAKLDEAGAVKTFGVADGELTFEIDDFTFEQGGYTFTKEGEYSTEVEVTNSDGDSWSLYLQSSESRDLSDGDTVTLSLSYVSYYDNGIEMKERLDNSDIFFTETEKAYTIKRNTPLTADTAKENIDLIKEQMTDYLSKEAFYDTRKIEIREIYYSEPKTVDTANVDFNKFIFIYYDKDDKDYNVYTCDNAYILNDDFLASNPRSEYNFDNDSIKEIKEDSDALNDKDRKITKIA